MLRAGKGFRDKTPQDGMDRDEAEEFFWFNIEGAYVGEATPVCLTSAQTLIEHRKG